MTSSIINTGLHYANAHVIREDKGLVAQIQLRPSLSGSTSARGHNFLSQLTDNLSARRYRNNNPSCPSNPSTEAEMVKGGMSKLSNR